MNEYTTEHIIKLDDISHIRHNPGMYIGDTEDCTRLLMEVLDNALDELQANRCKKIQVIIDTRNKLYSVVDWGRGFPFDKNLPVEKDPPVLVSTQIGTSGKFFKTNENSPYKIASGLHGVGLTVVNALSRYYRIITCRGNISADYLFENGKTLVHRQFSKQKLPFSTKVEFVPDQEYFKSTDVDIDQIKERLDITKICYPESELVITVDGKDTVIEKRIEQILEEISSSQSWYQISSSKGIESYTIYFTWVRGEMSPPQTKTFVNLINTGGVHFRKIYDAIRSCFNDKNKKIGKDECLLGLKVLGIFFLKKVSFDAQTKIRLTSSSDLTLLDDLEKKFRLFFNDKKELYNDLLELFHQYYLRRTVRNSRNQSSNGNKRFSTSFTKLKDCTQDNGELLIGEGDSAIGGLIHIRDPRRHAILPLRGVVPNAVTNIEKALNNECLSDIINAIGTGIGTSFNIDKMRYEKILLAADADPAGKFITALLIMFFAKVFPKIVEHGRLFVCETPLYGIGESKNFIPLWTKEELEKARQNGKKIRRFKGLGEFNPEELFMFTFGDKRKLRVVNMSKDYQKLEELLRSVNSRRLLLEENTTQEDL